MSEESVDPGRRKFFRFMAAAFLLTAWAPVRSLRALAATTAAGGLAATPECADDDEPTPSETEGPFFKPRSPRRSSLLESQPAGTRIVLAGRVFSRECQPLPGVLLDFWHADNDGEYDNVGFKLRGHQFTDEAGRYRLETIVPGMYPGRTRHFHVKVQAPHGKILTTQLYFPGERRNARDFLFRRDLLMTVKDNGNTKDARFHFILDLT